MVSIQHNGCMIVLDFLFVAVLALVFLAILAVSILPFAGLAWDAVCGIFSFTRRHYRYWKWGKVIHQRPVAQHSSSEGRRVQLP